MHFSRLWSPFEFDQPRVLMRANLWHSVRAIRKVALPPLARHIKDAKDKYRLRSSMDGNWTDKSALKEERLFWVGTESVAKEKSFKPKGWGNKHYVSPNWPCQNFMWDILIIFREKGELLFCLFIAQLGILGGGLSIVHIFSWNYGGFLHSIFRRVWFTFEMVI